jgi:hypothetical protein
VVVERCMRKNNRRSLSNTENPRTCLATFRLLRNCTPQTSVTGLVPRVGAFLPLQIRDLTLHLAGDCSVQPITCQQSAFDAYPVERRLSRGRRWPNSAPSAQIGVVSCELLHETAVQSRKPAACNPSPRKSKGKQSWMGATRVFPIFAAVAAVACAQPVEICSHDNTNGCNPVTKGEFFAAVCTCLVSDGCALGCGGLVAIFRCACPACVPQFPSSSL